MENISETLDFIKETILKHVPAKYIYLFGSHAYGEPREDSDIDILLVVPDDVGRHSELYGNIFMDFGAEDLYFVDLLICREHVFKKKAKTHFFEREIFNSGVLLYEH